MTTVATDRTALDAAIERHRDLLERAVRANRERSYFSAFPESPSPRVYGEGAADAGRQAFESLLHRRFDLGQPATAGWVGAERSPWGSSWASSTRTPTSTRCCPPCAPRSPPGATPGRRPRRAVPRDPAPGINAASHEIAHAVMHTSGQAFVMAFQAGGPHAQDRALEAVAYAYAERPARRPTRRWEKPQGKRPPLRMAKTFTVVPARHRPGHRLQHVPDVELLPGPVRQPGHRQRGAGQAAPAAPCCRSRSPSRRPRGARRGRLRPDLVHARRRAAGRGAGQDARRAPRGADHRLHRLHRVRRLARGATPARRQVYTEKAGVNTVVVDSTDDYRGMLANLAFSLVALQRPDVHHPAEPARARATASPTDGGHKSFDEFARRPRRGAVDGLLGDDARAPRCSARS